MDKKQKSKEDCMVPDIVTEERPWGKFHQFAKNEMCTVKILEVIEKKRLSLQSHQLRDELWVAIDDGLEVVLDDETVILNKGEHILIPKGSQHRLSAPNDKGRILEVSFGEFDENDEVRHQDDFNREKVPQTA